MYGSKGWSPLQKFFLGQENFQLCASAPTKNAIISFPWTRSFFSISELKNIQLQGGKNYLIVLSANEITECNQLKNKANTVKNRCEKSKRRVAIN